MRTIDKDHQTSEAAIFSRLWESEEGELSPALARHIVKVRFSKKDRSRMHELALKNQEGCLVPRERRELDNYIKVGDLIAILQSKARRLLKTKGQPHHENG